MKLITIPLILLAFSSFAQVKLGTLQKNANTNERILSRIHGAAYKRSSILSINQASPGFKEIQKDFYEEETLTIELFADLIVTAKRSPGIKQPAEGHYWKGELTSGAEGYLDIYSRNGLISGTVYTNTKVYKIDAMNQNAIRVSELDLTGVKNFECPHDSHPEIETTNNTPAPKTKKTKAGPSNPAIIDVMIIYPPSIETAMGGASNMANEVNYRIAEINQVFANSEIYVEFRLAHNQVETSVPANAQGAGDVRTTAVENLRDQYKADLVSFWSDNGSAGSGFNFEGTGSTTSGFNTSQFTLVQTYYTFIHESGHNLGAKHDRQTYYESSPTSSKLNVTPYYRYGKSFVGYRSVMSYSSCNDLPGGSSNDCERVPYFTNPNINVNGAPFGVPGNYQTYDVNGPANNAQRINETASYVEDYFQSLTSYYSLTVNNGIGTGNYAENASITITADNAPSGKTFDKWTGDIGYVTDINAASTTVTMPANTITLTATYKTLDYTTNVTITVLITGGSDDVEEYGDGSGTMYSTSSDLEMTLDGTKGNQAIGLKFRDIQIPWGMKVQSAYISFTSEGANSEATNLIITTDTNTSPADFGASIFDVSSRTRTASSVAWSPASWTLDQQYKTPDLSTIIQEVVGQSQWTLGNDMVFIIEGTGVRSAYAYEGDASKIAQLTIVFKEDLAPQLSSVTNQITQKNTSLTLDLTMVSATDPDGDNLSLIISSGSNYTVSGNTIIPNLDFVGDLLVPIKVTDGQLTSTELIMTITVDGLTSISSNEVNAISLNAGGLVQLQNGARAKNLQVINLKGQLVSENQLNSNEIDLNTYITTTGLYLVKIETTDGFLVYKIVKD